MNSEGGEEEKAPAADTGYTAGWDFISQWRNKFSYLTGKMTEEGQRQWLRDRDIYYEEEDCKTCEKHRDWLLAWSPTIRFLREHVQKLGGDLGKDNIYCRRCDVNRSGGFDQRFGIDLCANHFRNRDHVEDTLAHEMIHAWDHLRFKVRYGDLRHAACMEIRASNLSGECRFWREFWTRGQWKFTQQHQECVRRRAILSVSARPQCESVEQATKVVDEVWNSCSRDTRPFDEIYR